jgi:hypothetical protein
MRHQLFSKVNQLPTCCQTPVSVAAPEQLFSVLAIIRP